MVFAHSVDGRPQAEWETLQAHSLRVARGARQRADRFGAGDLAEMLGMLHDIGKMKPAFQRKLTTEWNNSSHSGEGARVLMDQGPIAAPFAGIIAGHHGYLPNYERLKERINGAESLALPDWCNLPALAWPDRIASNPDLAAYRLQFLVRFLYGALCDADDRETGAFYAEAEDRTRPSHLTCLNTDMQAAFDGYMARMPGDGEVNRLRREVLDHALSMAKTAPGPFTLTVPTGGGKTLTSLGFGLAHAAEHGLDRLIYVIPYTSIVEQTADAFHEVFASLGNDVVLEHHANADWAGEDESEMEQRRVMGASWDVPIVVTTAVQFFESLYSARKKRCRKLPSLARSVIVVDEAQTMPLALLRPCLAALQELMAGYGASVVLSTATQPALTQASGFPVEKEALEGAREIAPDPDRLYAALRRVTVRDVEALDDDALGARVRDARQVLCIVDNRVQARGLFDRIRDAQGATHLSTLMVPAHRRAVLDDVRERLRDERPVRLISTSLIEAGVDVDFPQVLRAAAGIDSIAQAAGRCNREGRLEGPGLVEVFRPEQDAPPAVEQFAAIGRKVLADHPDDPTGQAAVAAYFRDLWDTYGSEALDAAEVGEQRLHGILHAIRKKGDKCPFEDIEAAFRMIPDGQKTVIVLDGPWGVGADRLWDMRFSSPGAVAKLVQPHSVNVPWSMWRTLWDGRLLSWWEAERFEDQFAVLGSSDLYDDTAGLSVEGEAGGIT